MGFWLQLILILALDTILNIPHPQLVLVVYQLMGTCTPKESKLLAPIPFSVTKGTGSTWKHPSGPMRFYTFLGPIV